MALGAINGLPPRLAPPVVTPDPTPARGAGRAGGGSFASEVESFVKSTNVQAQEASHAMDEYAAGRQNDLHGTLIQAEKANVSLHLLVSVRNKIIEAYREVMRMGA